MDLCGEKYGSKMPTHFPAIEMRRAGSGLQDQLAGAVLKFLGDGLVDNLGGFGQFPDGQRACLDLKINGHPQMPAGFGDIKKDRVKMVLLQNGAAKRLDLLHTGLVRREQEDIPESTAEELDVLRKHKQDDKHGNDLVKIGGKEGKGGQLQIPGQEKGKGHPQAVHDVQLPAQKLRLDCGGGKIPAPALHGKVAKDAGNAQGALEQGHLGIIHRISAG